MGTEWAGDGAFSGAAMAAHQVGVWVENDRGVHERLRRIVSGEDRYMIGLAPVERVRMFVLHLLYQDDGSTYRATWRAFRRDLAGFESRMPTLVRGAFDRRDFDGIDWDGIVSSLGEE